MGNQQQSSGTSKQGSSFRDLVAIAALFGLVFALWLVDWVAAKLSFGKPTLGFTDFLKVSQQIQRFKADHGSFVVWHYVGAYGPVVPILFWVVAILTIAAMVVAGLGLTFLIRGGIPDIGLGFGRRRNMTKYSHWATARDIRKLLMSAPQRNRLILGKFNRKIVAAEDEISCLVVGPTRSGKTSGLIVPNLLHWRGPAIVTSTKAELIELTGGIRQTNGPVFIYDPAGEIGSPRGDRGLHYVTTTFSPLGQCFKLDERSGRKVANFDASWVTASTMSTGMTKGGGGGNSDWRHWAESFKLLVAPLFFTAAAAGLAIDSVCDWLDALDLDTPMQILQRLKEQTAAEEQDTRLRDQLLADIDQATKKLLSIQGRPDKERATCFSTAHGVFSHFAESAVKESAMTSTYDPETLLRNNGTLYLVTPQDNPERLAALYVTIVKSTITKAFQLANGMHRGRLEPALGVFLDELANVCPLEELDSYASQGAGRGVLLMSIVQNISQLTDRYGQAKTGTIVNNHPALVVLPGLKEAETSDLLTKLTGQSLEKDVSVSYNDGRQSRSVAERAQSMVTVDSLRQLRDGDAMALYRSKPPIFMAQWPWYLDPALDAMTKQKYIPGITQVEALDDDETQPPRRPGLASRLLGKLGRV